MPMVNIHSKDIQAAIFAWAQEQNFTAPYGIFMSEHISKSGRPYKSVTFGRARTLDATVDIYNKSFIIVTTNWHGSQVFKSYQDLMKFLEDL